MQKTRINLALDADLLDFVKDYAEAQRTTVSDIFTQFALNLKRTKEQDSTELIIADPAFSAALLESMKELRAGKVMWKDYDEVF